MSPYSEEGGVEIHFDNFVIWELPREETGDGRLETGVVDGGATGLLGVSV
jgi:hypothetical protein